MFPSKKADIDAIREKMAKFMEHEDDDRPADAARRVL